MVKIVCDKCGREVYMKNPDLTGRAKIGFEEFDLCKFCILDVKRFIKAEQTENSSEKPNNCEHITEDGVTCAKYPACDDCPDNPLNKVKGSERLVKGSEKPNNSTTEDCSTVKERSE